MPTKATKKPARRKGRPTATQSIELEEKIKDTALNLFLDKGYDAVTMDEIAAAIDITKRTLYLRYKDKSQLFAAALRKSKDIWTFTDPASATSGQASLEKKLVKLGEALLEQALDPRVVKLARIASTQADYFPEELRNDYDIYLSPRIQSIVDVLKQHEKELDRYVTRDYPVIAELFISSVTGIPARLAGFGTLRSAQLEKKRIRIAVKVFLQGILKP